MSYFESHINFPHPNKTSQKAQCAVTEAQTWNSIEFFSQCRFGYKNSSAIADLDLRDYSTLNIFYLTLLPPFSYLKNTDKNPKIIFFPYKKNHQKLKR